MFRKRTGEVTGLSVFLLSQYPAIYCCRIYLIVSLSLSNAVSALCYSLLISCHLFVRHLYSLVLLPHTVLSVVLPSWFFLPVLSCFLLTAASCSLLG